MAGNSTDAGRSVTSKVIAILMTFRTGEAYSLTEIARLTGLPVSTAHRLAMELWTGACCSAPARGSSASARNCGRSRIRPRAAVPNLHERARRVMEDLAAAAGRAVVRLGRAAGRGGRVPGEGAGRPAGAGGLRVRHHAAARHRDGPGAAGLRPDAARRRGDRARADPVHRRTRSPTPMSSATRLSVIRLTRVAVCRREYEAERCTVAVPVFGVGGRDRRGARAESARRAGSDGWCGRR